MNAKHSVCTQCCWVKVPSQCHGTCVYLYIHLHQKSCIVKHQLQFFLCYRFTIVCSPIVFKKSFNWSLQKKFCCLCFRRTYAVLHIMPHDFWDLFKVSDDEIPKCKMGLICIFGIADKPWTCWHEQVAPFLDPTSYQQAVLLFWTHSY